MQIPSIPDSVRQRVMADLLLYPSQNTPCWVQILGIPGAGKSELVRLLATALAFRHPHVLAATDEYLMQIPDFLSMEDREKAFRHYDPLVTALGLEVHQQLIVQKSDVIFERSLASTDYRDFMYKVKKAGYTMVMVRVDVDFETAKQRAVAREALTGRHVPESVITERVKIVQDRWREMKSIADYMVEVENNGNQSVEDTFLPTVTLVENYVRNLK